jgi:hypothetical protein
MIEYRFRVSSAAVFTLYSYSKALEYRFIVGSLKKGLTAVYCARIEELTCLRLFLALRTLAHR